MIGVRFIAVLCLTGMALSACAHSMPQLGSAHIITPPDYSAASIDLSSPENTAYSMMIAMYRGDTTMVDQVFAPDGTLNRLRPTGEIETDGLPKWRDWVGTLDVGQANEELFSITVEQFDRLATVWAPFVIRFDGEIVGCGVNQFTMADMDGDWRVLSGIDVQAPKASCASFKSDYAEYSSARTARSTR